jgi:hypothetical protein
VVRSARASKALTAGLIVAARAAVQNPCGHANTTASGQLDVSLVDAFAQISSSGSSTTRLAEVAPDVVCHGRQLEAAVMADGGGVILGMLHQPNAHHHSAHDTHDAATAAAHTDATATAHADHAAAHAAHATELATPTGHATAHATDAIAHAAQATATDAQLHQACTQREAEGYASGMGLIFRAVAQLHPLGSSSLTSSSRSHAHSSRAVAQQESEAQLLISEHASTAAVHTSEHEPSTAAARTGSTRSLALSRRREANSRRREVHALDAGRDSYRLDYYPPLFDEL